MAVAFANIFMAKVEIDIPRQRAIKPLVWKRFIDDVFSLLKKVLYLPSASNYSKALVGRAFKP